MLFLAFYLPDRRRRDLDNLIAGTKAHIDALVAESVLLDDSARVVPEEGGTAYYTAQQLTDLAVAVVVTAEDVVNQPGFLPMRGDEALRMETLEEADDVFKVMEMLAEERQLGLVGVEIHELKHHVAIEQEGRKIPDLVVERQIDNQLATRGLKKTARKQHRADTDPSALVYTSPGLMSMPPRWSGIATWWTSSVKKVEIGDRVFGIGCLKGKIRPY